MRKHHKKLISDIITGLAEATSEIQKNFFNKEMQILSVLINDCLDITTQVTDFIIQLGGAEVKTIEHLNRYSDILSKLSDHQDNNYEYIKQLKKQVNIIINSAKTDIKADKFEVVFFPYKASMWDSFESIWLEAKDDPNCDAFVVPIPYYEKNPDGSFGKIHYEGGSFPGYVPVINWRQYDIETRCPDVVFIHNPYDNNNFVTSVHQDYYAEWLKNFTDLLIYIPYFVTGGEDLEEHFCVNPGTLFAHETIVQSENIRQAYTKHLNKFGKAGKKFITLGSPKFDAVINKKRKDFTMPDEWVSLIGNKKIILYNTSLSAILQGDNQYLDKLRSVLETFKGRDDAVLWWRPHPLSETTYSSMRPQLSDEYERIIEVYKRDEYGIYDDTTDLHRAIAWSDAYYGDGSSLLTLYQLTGKPIFFQNIFINTKYASNYKLWFLNLHEDDENLWFISLNLNVFFKLNTKTWKAEYIGRFVSERIGKMNNLYTPITLIEGKLYIAPRLSNEILIYNISSDEFKRISILNQPYQSKFAYNIIQKFCMAISYGDYVFFIGYSYPAIVRLNINNNSIDYFTDWISPLEEIMQSSDGVYFLNGYITGEKLLLPACNANAVVEFEMDTCVSKIYEVGIKNNSYRDICFDGCDYWILPRRSSYVIKWNPKTDTYKEYNTFPEGFISGKVSFFNIHFLNGYVYLIPYHANMAIKINVKTDEISIAEPFQSECEIECEQSNIFNYLTSINVGDKVYAFTGKTHRLIGYDCKTGERREEEILFPESEIIKMNEKSPDLFYKPVSSCMNPNDCIFHEGGFLKLQGFIQYTIHDSEEKAALSEKQIELRKSVTANPDGTAGAKIYNHVKRAVLGT
jgi:hypothetical protein